MKNFKKLIKEAHLGNPLNEAEDKINELDSLDDPALIKARAAKMAAEKEKAKQAALDKKYGSSWMDKFHADTDLQNELADLEDEREDVLRNMEEEAEPEGGPIADDYGSILNDIDARMAEIKSDLEDLRMYESVNENEEFKVGDKVTYLGHPAVVTATKEYNGRDFVSVDYDKGTGKTKASMILVKSGDVKAVNEMLFMDRVYKDAAETSINLDDFKRTIKATYGKYAEDDDTLEAAYERFRITRPDLEEASDTDVGGGAKPNDGELDVKSSSDAALDIEVEKMGYNESQGFDFKQMVKEALTPKNLR